MGKPASTLTTDEIAKAFNEWMRRYVADPSGFAVEFQTVLQFRDEGFNDVPSYGADCAAYLVHLAGELSQ